MLSDYVLELFHDAIRNEKLWDSVETYLYLREIFPDPIQRPAFEKRYWTYYRLGAARPHGAWRTRYFNLLFDHNNEKSTKAKLYEELLEDLYRHQPKLQFSFVSKLVSFHDESRPIYDEHVRHFFGLAPPKFGSKEFRISGFVCNLNEIAHRYTTWTQQKPFSEILGQMRERCPRLNSCHDIRLIDFLVHKVEAR